MAVAASASAYAGGLLTNTNQNAAYLRNFAQEGQISLTSLYANPAGNAFLSNGWHLSINSQTAVQQRNIDTKFPLFALNTKTPGVNTHEFQGKAFAPVIPSITVSHNWDRWAVSAHFGLTGGGGKCEFDDGLGSFEALYSGTMAQLVPALVNATIAPQMPLVQAGVQNNVAGQISQALQGGGMAPATADATAAALAGTGSYSAVPASQLSGYGLNAYMKGRSYYFGLQLGAAYKIQDNLSAYIGIRGVYATCNYNGYVQDINANYTAAANYFYNVPAAPGFDAIGGSGTQVLATGSQSLSDKELTLNTDQTGFGVTPIFGIDWKINDQWNVAVKYEANTRMSLKNKSEMNDFAKAQAAEAGNTLAQFQDGEKVREDIPAILALGAEYKMNDKVRFDGSAKMYFDKTARKYGSKEDLIDHNTWELALGAEYDICKLITVSGSWQITQYGLNDKYMNDLSFNLSNNSIGLGLCIHPTKRFNIDLGYMHTIYGDRTVTTATAIGDKVDTYSRKNDVVGIGFNFDF